MEKEGTYAAYGKTFGNTLLIIVLQIMENELIDGDVVLA